MQKRELSDDIIEATEATPSEVVTLLQKFKPGEYWQKAFTIRGNPNNTTSMTAYVERLKQEGLDIGKGHAEFGYRMPIPEKGSVRYLEIYRRS